MSQPETGAPDDAVEEAGKPSRTYTKRMTVANNLAAWIAIGAAIYLGRDMAGTIVPVMVMLIASLLGIYQGVGHFDLRATSGKTKAPTKSGETQE